MKMIYDIDTPEGMENAKRWQESLIAKVADGATWTVPRSGSIITFDKKNKVATITSLMGDESIVRVFKEIGWTVKEA